MPPILQARLNTIMVLSYQIDLHIQYRQKYIKAIICDKYKHQIH